MINSIKALKQKYIDTLQKRLDALENEILEGSPVLTGYFKSQWHTKKDYSNFRFSMSNDTVYALALWRYHHSKKGWSPITGDIVVEKHKRLLIGEFDNVNKSVVTI